MAKKNAPNVQGYPRIHDSGSKKKDGLLDESALEPHAKKVDADTLHQLISKAIRNANRKSSREMLKGDDVASEDTASAAYEKAGKELFKYFRQYATDPASVAIKLNGRDCRHVAAEQFRQNALQKERMNSGWRYQYLATDCAIETGRFNSISELGLKDADFNASIDIKNSQTALSIYVSVKNRANTIGGPDWPGAIQALETYATTDNNRRGPYLCVFAFVMERGQRSVKRTKEGDLRSPNTELWSSDYFWPFFTNLTYEEVMQAVLQTLLVDPSLEQASIEIPEDVITSFANQCKLNALVDEDYKFNDPSKLVSFFCQSVSIKSRTPPSKSRSRKFSSVSLTLPLFEKEN